MISFFSKTPGNSSPRAVFHGSQLKYRRQRVLLFGLLVVILLSLSFFFFFSRSTMTSTSLVRNVESKEESIEQISQERLQETIQKFAAKIHELTEENEKLRERNLNEINSAPNKNKKEEPEPLKFIPPDPNNVHYVMTTDCGRYSDWQSIIAYNSLRKTGFKGNFTRLIACEKKPERMMSQATYFSDYFITPFFGNNPGPDFFPPLAKPNSIMSWIEDGPGRFIHDDQQIVLIDQDFISLDYLKPQAPCGSPMAQKYGMGSGFLHDGTADKYCRGKCKNFKGKIGEYLVGPPYMLCMGDLRKIGVLWRDITREITKNSKYGQHNKEWLSDMYGYIMGSIILGLPHKVRVDWMISIGDSSGEWMDFYKAGLEAPSLGREPLKIAPTFHVCQQYEVPNDKDPTTTIKLNKHEYHERDAEALLNCDSNVSKRRLFNTMLGKRKEVFSILMEKLPFKTPSFQEALEATIDLKNNGESSKYTYEQAKLMRNKWAIGTFVDHAEAAFKEYRKRVCVEPMNAF